MKSIIPVIAILLFAIAGEGSETSIVINEIMYHSASDLVEDEYIELVNRSGEVVDLSGWYFADGIRFSFPAGTTMQADEYLVVAKDKSKIRVKYGLHTVYGNYIGELSNGGETVSLANAKGQIIDRVTYSDSPPWPVAADEFGPSLECINPDQDNDQPADWSTSTTTGDVAGTPGAQNTVWQSTLPPFVEEYSHQPQQPTSSDRVTITARVSCGEIIQSVSMEYTIDSVSQWVEMQDDGQHGDGLVGDGVYGAQIDPQASQTPVFYLFQAVDRMGRMGRSPLATDPTPRHGYLVYDGEANTDLPVYFLFIDRRTLQRMDPNSDTMVDAVVAIEGEVFDGVHVRYRGAWARSWPKKNWKIRFNKGHYYKGWRTANLNGEYHDRAFMREQIGYDLFEDAGVPHPQSRFIWLQLNGANFGLYCEIEQPDERFLERVKREGGSLYKSEGRYNVLGSESEYRSTYQKETNVEESFNSLITMVEEINSIPNSQVYDYFIQHFNVETYIDYLVVNACISNWDSIVKNHFAFQDVALSGKWEFIPWDLDRTWGEFPDWNLYSDQDILAGIKGHPGPQLGSDWWNRVQNRLLENKTFLQMFYNRMRQFLLDSFNEERMNERIDAVDTLIRDEVPREVAIHGTAGSWNYATEVENLKSYVKERREFLFQSMPTDVEDWALYE